MLFNRLVFFCFSLITFACSAQPPVTSIRFPNGKICLLLDSAAAGEAITYDRRDAYFDKVNASEMSIQMREPLTDGQTRENLLPRYIAYLKSDVEGFSYEESKFVEGVMEKVFRTVNGVSPNIFPDTLKLIKTKGRHYGDGVWYTRENCIIIPADELGKRKTNPFSTTMYHELFHVWSRLNPAKSDRAYQLIGFEAIGFDQLQVPPGLAQRVLYNPDGVDYAQKIVLAQADGVTIPAVPVLYANHLGWSDEQNTFFAYVEFSLFQIEKQDDGKYRILVKDDGYSSTLNMQEQPDFFRQIKDNTGYIIHPDEVLADNFAFIMQEKNGQKVSLKFSEAGKKLLTDLEAVVKEK
ncbi:MAG: hypothetical protein SFV22_11790 [Saprospiraceae bacterium]|nr:hypothetical protein [Saprospiraceae bacterium]